MMTARHWTLDDIPWQSFQPGKVNADLLQVIKTAAMVERNGADYGQYLGNVFADDPEFKLAADVWSREEEQHGMALGRWAQMADPNFDFDAAFKRFTDLFRIPVDAQTSVRGSRAGELCARCVVETGTSSFYAAIRDATAEPVLKEICTQIAQDEIRHYKLFYKHFEAYQIREPISALTRLKVALGRIQESSDDELASAYHAGTGQPGPYERSAATEAYTARALGLYREQHVRHAAKLVAKAAGLHADGWLARAFAKIMWVVIRVRGRKYRALFAMG